MRYHIRNIGAAAIASALAVPTAAATLDVTVTNRAAPGGFSLTPVYSAFHDGAFDAFDVGAAASPGVELLAELGDVGGLPPERLAVSPQSTAGVVAAPANGVPPIEPGESGSLRIDVDPQSQRYFTYLSMLVPTNDTFIGNDDPLAYELFDASGAFTGDLVIDVTGLDAYDAGTEVNDPAQGAAFVQGVDGAAGATEGGVVGPPESQAAFAGIIAANGQTIDGAAIDFTGDRGAFSIATITVTQVAPDAVAPIPLPAGLPLLGAGLAALAWAARRRA